MTFNREERYIVVKIKDLKFAGVENKLREAINEAGIQTRECVVVESDWPEYEIVWEMLQDRVEGKPNRIEQLERELAASKAREESAWRRGRAVGLIGLNDALSKAEQAKKEDMWGNEQLTQALLLAEEKLAESQAREAKLRGALEYVLDTHHYTGNDGEDATEKARQALSLPTDDTALRQAIAKELRSMAETFESEHEWVSKVAISAQMRNRADELENGK